MEQNENESFSSFNKLKQLEKESVSERDTQYHCLPNGV